MCYIISFLMMVIKRPSPSLLLQAHFLGDTHRQVMTFQVWRLYQNWYHRHANKWQSLAKKTQNCWASWTAFDVSGVSLNHYPPCQPEPALILHVFAFGPSLPRKAFLVTFCPSCLWECSTNQNPPTAHIFWRLEGVLEGKTSCHSPRRSHFTQNGCSALHAWIFKMAISHSRSEGLPFEA